MDIYCCHHYLFIVYLNLFHQQIGFNFVVVIIKLSCFSCLCKLREIISLNLGSFISKMHFREVYLALCLILDCTSLPTSTIFGDYCTPASEVKEI